MTDAVAIALITGITSTITTVATLVLRRDNRRQTEKQTEQLDKTLKEQHAQTRVSLAACCHHTPADMPPRGRPLLEG